MICQLKSFDRLQRSAFDRQRQVERRKLEVRRHWTNDERIRRLFEAQRRQQELWEMLAVDATAGGA